MRVRLTQEAKGELADAQDWYDHQAPGLGPRFMAEYRALAARLADNPRRFPALHGVTRRAGFRRFPYGLFFRIRADEVEVFACLHVSRDPRHWQRRAQ
jgi:toxin ParE1/3/4